MSLIMAKLKETAGSVIRMDIFALNMERFLRKKIFSYALLSFAVEATSLRETLINMALPI